MATRLSAPAPAILTTVPERPRWLTLSWAMLSFAQLTLLAALVRSGFEPLSELDHRGVPAQEWAVNSDWLDPILRTVEIIFGTLGMVLATLGLCGWLLVRRQPRAAAFAAGVMIVTSLSTTVLKTLVGRVRPEWQDPIGFLENNAFPSGHVSATAAYAGIVMVLASMFLRRPILRRAAIAGLVLVVFVVAADRVLLGRHYPSDTVGGMLLGAGVVLLGMWLYSPVPRSHAAAAAPLVESVPGTRDLAVIVNPVKLEDPVHFRTIVTELAAASGWSRPKWYYTTVEDPGTGMAHDASVAGADLVVVCGGDGTVREVCAELAGTGIPVGIIPAGTGNLLARNLDIPLYLRSAIDVALNGQDRAIDLVAVSGDGIEDTHFLVMAGMGMDAAIMEGVSEDIKNKVGWFAYVVSGTKSLRSPAIRVEVSVDGGPPTKHRAKTVVIGNVGYLQAGMPLLPDATIDDGKLDVLLLDPPKLWSWVPLVARILSKRTRTDDALTRMTGSTVEVRTNHDTPRQLDGDAVGAGRELRMECIHGRLLVRVPRS